MTGAVFVSGPKPSETRGASGNSRISVLIAALGVSRHRSVSNPPEFASRTPTVSPVSAPRLSTLIPDLPELSGLTDPVPSGAGAANGPRVGLGSVFGSGLTLNSRGFVGSRDRGVWAPTGMAVNENAARRPIPVKPRKKAVARNLPAPLARQLVIRNGFLYRFRRCGNIPGRQEREAAGKDRDHDHQNDNSRFHTFVPTIPSFATID